MSNKTFLGKVGTTPKGEWSASVTYERLDWVTYQGSSYIALAQNTNSTPSDNNSNWMVAAKHGEFTEQQLEDFKAAVVADSKQEMDAYTDTKKGVLDTYTTAKKGELDTYESAKETELNTYTGTKKGELDTHTTQKISDFDSNATAKTGTFNDNATSKTSTFNTNASNKTTAFNDNVTAKTTAFDEHVASKTQDFDDHIADFQGELNNLEEVLGIDVDTYSSSSTYALGDLVVYENKVYKCTTAITVAEEWDSTKWTEVDILSLIQELQAKEQEQEQFLAEFNAQYNAMLRSRKYTVGSGESVTLNNTAEGIEVRKLDISGNSKQTQLTGKNLFNKNNLTQYGFTGTVDGDGAIIYNAGSSTSNSITISGFKENTQYSFHCEGKNYGSGDAGQGNIKVYYTDETDSGTNFFIFQMSNTYKAKEFTTASGKTIDYVRFNNGGNGSNYSWKLNIDTMQIEEGTSCTSYEPYCGGVASPNPSYPQAITSSGDSGSINNKVENKNKALNDDPEHPDANYVSSGTGTQAVQYSTTEKGYYTITSRARIFELKQGESYKFSIDCKQRTTDNLKMLMRLYNTETHIETQFYEFPRVTSSNYTRLTKNVTIPEGYNAIKVYFYVSFYFNNIQIEEGTTATAYTPHAEQNFTLPCQQPMRSIGTTRDNFFKNVVGSEYYNAELTENVWYERHAISRKVFDGTEDWNFVNGVFVLNINNYSKADMITCASNMYKAQSNVTATTSMNDLCCAFRRGDSTNSFYIKDTNISNLEDFETNLQTLYAQNKPLYVDYITTTATIIYLQCTSAQVEVLEAMEKAKSYYEQTNIYSTDEVSPIYEVEAYQDENLVTDSLDARLTLLE